MNSENVSIVLQFISENVSLVWYDMFVRLYFESLIILGYVFRISELNIGENKFFLYIQESLSGYIQESLS